MTSLAWSHEDSVRNFSNYGGFWLGLWWVKFFLIIRGGFYFILHFCLVSSYFFMLPPKNGIPVRKLIDPHLGHPQIYRRIHQSISCFSQKRNNTTKTKDLRNLLITKCRTNLQTSSIILVGVAPHTPQYFLP